MIHTCAFAQNEYDIVISAKFKIKVKENLSRHPDYL